MLVMIAQLFIHPDTQVITEKALELLTQNGLTKEHPDVLWLEEEKLGVEQAKVIREFVSLKPYQASQRAVVIIDAGNMTIDAQNSLLKSLEEPAADNLFVMGLPSEDSLLPTILSRCQIRHLKSSTEQQVTKKDSAHAKKIEEIMAAPTEKRFQIVEKIDDKKEFLKSLIAYSREKALANPSPQQTQLLKDLIQAEKWARQNVNMRAVLEYLMLRIL